MNKIPTDHHYKPPRFGAWVLARLFPGYGEHPAVGDLTEVFSELVRKRGLRYARLWFWWQVCLAVPTALRDMVLSSLSMLGHYITTARRNIVRNKIYSLINLAGLTVGVTCCFLILSWVRYELTYDSFHKNSGELYRIISEFHNTSGDINHTTTSQAPLAAALKDSYPEVVNSARAIRWVIPVGLRTARFGERVWLVDESFLEMFQFENALAPSDLVTFDQPRAIILTERVAQKHFGDEDPVGKTVFVGSGSLFKIAAVIKNLPPNSHLDMDCLIPLQFTRRLGWKLDEWGGFNFKTYVQLRKGADPRDLGQKVRGVLKTFTPQSTTTIRLQPLRHIHLYNLSGDGGLITYIYIFSFMAVFVLVIGCINYMNLATARAAGRTKEIGVRKVVGAARWQLIRQFSSEAFCLTMAAGALSILLTRLSLPLFARMTGRMVSLPYSLSTFVLLAGIVCVAGIFSGLYPALYLSGVKTVHVLRGTHFSRQGNGAWFRRILVVFQFSVSIFLFISTLVVYKQIGTLKNSDLGYRPEGVICMNMTAALADSYTELRSEILRVPAVSGMTRTNTVLDAPQSSATSDVISWEGKKASESLPWLHVMGVDTDFASTYGIEMKAGRFFSEEYPSELRDGVVLNEAAVEAMDLQDPVGKAFHFWDYDGMIIGVIKNFHFSSLHHSVEPLVLKLGFSLNTVSIRLNSKNIGETLGRIEDVIGRVAPNYSFEYEFLDERLELLYHNEKRMEGISRAIAILAVFISCLGLLGLAVFTTQQRTKEIGIRKILGSSNSRVIWLLTREFSQWVLAANVIAWPIAYISARTWLQNFAYRTPLDIWMFLLSGGAALVIAVMTVGLLAVKTAGSDPVESLRHE